MTTSPYYQTDRTTLYHGDCLQIHPQIEGRSVDLILTDLPYGILDACSWDQKLPLDQLWQEWKRVLKPSGVVVLFGTQPFTTELIASNREWFKYCWYWEKTNSTGFANAKKQPLRCIEEIAVFYQKQPTYNPQDVIRLNTARVKTKKVGSFMGKTGFKEGYLQTESNYPKSLLKHANPFEKHPTQKPLSLLQYLIKTHCNEGDTVLDSTCGSGSTLVAAQYINRRSIGIELDLDYCKIAASRLGKLEPDLIRKESEATGQTTIFDILGA